MPRPEVDRCTAAARDPRTAVVIGAGVAGAAIAEALARRGTVVTVLEKHRTVACGASGNARAVIRPLLARDERDPLARFFSDAARFAIDRLEILPEAAKVGLGLRKGAHWVHPRAVALRQSGHRARALDAADTRALLGHTTDPGLWLPDAVSLSPAQLCREWLAHPGITVRHRCAVDTVHSERDGCTVWGHSGQLLARAGFAVFACGVSQTAWMADPTRGLHSTWGLSATLRGDAGLSASLLSPLALSPMPSGVAISTGHWRDRPTLERALASVEWPHWLTPRALTGARLAQRLHTPDRLPIAGALPDVEASLQHLAPLRVGQTPRTPAAYRPHQYVIGALGGRGVSSALWTGELLARAIHGESDTLQALHPLRFCVRALRRNDPAL